MSVTTVTTTVCDVEWTLEGIAGLLLIIFLLLLFAVLAEANNPKRRRE
jgi:hypothetical protein